MKKYDIGFAELIVYADDLAKDIGMRVQNIQDLRRLVQILCNVSAADMAHAHAFRLGEWLGIV